MRANLMFIDSCEEFLSRVRNHFEANRQIGPYRVEQFAAVSDVSLGLTYLHEHRPEVIIVDPSMPLAPEGTGLVAAIQARIPSSRIIEIKNDRSGNDDNSLQFRMIPAAGGHRTVQRPVTVSALIPVIGECLSAYAKRFDAVYRLPDMEFCPAKRYVRKRGREIKLPPKENLIFRYLLMASGSVSKQELLRNVWGYAANVSTHTVETHIYRLRQKIEDRPKKPRHLLTDSSGYCLKF